MAHSNIPPRKNLPPDVLYKLVKLARSYPISGWDFEEWMYTNVVPSIQTAIPEIVQYIDVLKGELQSQGFVVLGLSKLLDDLAANEAASTITLLLSNFGIPLRVFLKHPHWRRLEVDLKRPLASSGGTGNQPFHMDFVNAENPPDLICLLCIRPDPLGGGASLIASLDGLNEELDLVHQETLKLRIYEDGEVRDLNGVGHDINPFSVLAPGTRWAYRYTGKLTGSASNDEARQALQAVDDVLSSRKVSLILSRGYLLILDQHRVVHGRQVLGQNQHQISEDMRRLLLQSYIRLKTEP